MSQDDEWLTTVECARRLRRHRRTLYTYIARGLLRATQMVPRGQILISRRSVEDMLSRRMNRPIR